MKCIFTDYQSLPVTINDHHHSGGPTSTGSIQIPTVLTSASHIGGSRNISQFSMQSGDQCPVPDFDGKKGKWGGVEFVMEF